MGVEDTVIAIIKDTGEQVIPQIATAVFGALTAILGIVFGRFTKKTGK